MSAPFPDGGAGPPGVAGRAVYALLGLAPAGAVGRSRTLGRGARAVDAAVALACRPLFGSVVPIRTGVAAGLLLRAERRSTAWITGKVEPEVQRVLAELLRPGATFVDVGAGIGFFTLLAARLVGPEGRVAAFEPSPVHAESVRANLALNAFANVELHEQGLSDRSGAAFLDDPAAATAVLRPERRPGSAVVETVSLDDLLSRRPELVPEVVKIDVEGHEDAVLRGMATTIARIRPHLVIELHGDVAFLRALEVAGYEWRVLEAGASLEDARDWGHVLASPARGRP